MPTKVASHEFLSIIYYMKKIEFKRNINKDGIELSFDEVLFLKSYLDFSEIEMKSFLEKHLIYNNIKEKINNWYKEHQVKINQ